MSDSFDCHKLDAAIGRVIEDGHQAFADGLRLDQNPYKKGTSYFDFWEFGWNEEATERCEKVFK